MQPRSTQRIVVVLCCLQTSFLLFYYLIPNTEYLRDKIALAKLWRASSQVGTIQIGNGSKILAWPHPANEFIGAVVVAGRADSDLAWIKLVSEQKWLAQVYNVDAPYEGEKTLTVLHNKGHEAMVYLTYIIDNYWDLPPYTIFIHGHLESWHQESDIHTIVRNVRLAAVDQIGYISLRCDWYPSCPAELKLVHHDAVVWGPGVHRQDTEDAISNDAWGFLFPDVPMPETLASQCCAQFVVTRDAIRRNGLKDYIRMRQWILETDLIDDVSGRVFEKLWAYIMTGVEVNCPSPHACACEYFGKCEKQQWKKPPPELAKLPQDSQ